MAESLAKLDYSILQQCMHCGMCLPTCPTYVTTLHERNSPRGRIALMRAVADGELGVGAQFAEEMSYCVGCLACQTACPAGVDYAHLLETARTEVETRRVVDSRARRFWRTITLRGLFLRPGLLRFTARLLRLHQRSGFESFVRRRGLTRLLPPSLRRLEPRAPRIAPEFSNRLIRSIDRPKEEPVRHRVLLLTGCVQDLLYPEINRDTADVLLANGCEVHTPPIQPCCGSLHAHNGERGLAQSLARRWLDLVDPERFDAIITNAGGCGSHLKHYGRLLADDARYAARAQAWDRRVQDIHEWLHRIGCRAPTVGPASEPLTVTYHDSCHLAHGQGVIAQPRAMLRLIPGLNLVELPESTWCCGSAGIYSITQPDQADLLLQRKIGHLRGTRALVVATANPGCHLQLAQGLSAAGISMTVLHPVTLLARAYRRETSPV